MGGGGGQEIKTAPATELEILLQNFIYEGVSGWAEGVDPTTLVIDTFKRWTDAIDEAEKLFREFPERVEGVLVPRSEEFEKRMNEISSKMGMQSDDFIKIAENYGADLKGFTPKLKSIEAVHTAKLNAIAATPGTNVTFGGQPLTTVKPLRTMASLADIENQRYMGQMGNVAAQSELLTKGFGGMQSAYESALRTGLGQAATEETGYGAETEALLKMLGAEELLPGKILGLAEMADKSTGLGRLEEMFYNLYGPRMGTARLTEPKPSFLDSFLGPAATIGAAAIMAP